ncbi:MAG: hypothetical protein A3I66_11095 [Burkholderiales bacterium RIFCSPLOWO2_02_FULL_57_36]|nr:MAG: hypothetical protein A3I66_11095 [Burkholderiales bacterium RIFCSPLOWO2_02_FULL_57_36]
MKQSTYRTTHQNQGFTLVELVVVMIIVAVLAGLAAPSFKSFIVNERVRGASFDLVSHLTLARSEAIKQNENVTIASTSTTSAWQNGWSISGAGGDTVKTQGAYPKLTISTGSGTGPSSITFNRSGRAGSSVTFQIADLADGVTPESRCVTVGLTAQPMSKKGSC